MPRPTLDPSDFDHQLRLRHLMATGAAIAIREAARVTRSEAARQSGVSRSMLERWERKTVVPHGPAATRYAYFLLTVQDRLTEFGTAS